MKKGVYVIDKHPREEFYGGINGDGDLQARIPVAIIFGKLSHSMVHWVMGFGLKQLVVYIMLGVMLGVFFSACKAMPARVASKDIMKIQRNGYSADGRQPYLEEVSFVQGTHDPLQVKYLKKGAVDDVLCKENRFFYKNGVVQRVDYYIYLNSKKTKVGKKLFFFEGLKPVKYEYYAIPDLYDRSINLSGIDMYTYSEKNGLYSRRVIEYAYDTTTRTKIQISQYIIKYEHGKPLSLKAWLLDVATNNIIVQEEKNQKVIDEMIKNIEKSLLDRAQGVMYLSENCK